MAARWRPPGGVGRPECLERGRWLAHATTSSNHRAKAIAAGLELPASRVVAFGNPALGTPLMQENVVAALDLPLRMLVADRGDGSTTITYDGPDYLRRRHALGSVDGQLEQAEGALARFASAAADRMIDAAAGDASGIDAAEGVVIVQSTRGAEATLAALLGAIEGNPALSVVTQVDHRAAAVSVGLSLGFATVVMFGSAAVGTPLMQDSPSVGLDLPLKILVPNAAARSCSRTARLPSWPSAMAT